ncbi:MAG TPA: chemotaxis protein CheX [bacterium]|nr:chemotaxis protein CheX [bacterium]
MKAEYLNPFLKGISSILEEVAGERPALGRPFLRPGYPYSVDGVAIFIGVTGHLSGQVVICIQEACARGIAAAMLMEGSIAKLDEYAQSALAELVNMIVASATIGLAEAGYRTDITPPSVVTGEKIEISNQAKIPTLAIPLSIMNGKIEVNLSLVEAGAAGK